RDLPQQSRGSHLVPTRCSGTTESSLPPGSCTRVSAPTRARCDLARGGQNARSDSNERYSDSRRGMQNRNQLDTLFIVTRIMTSSLTCRPILYWDEAGLVLFVIFVTRVAEIVTSWARSKII